MVATGLTSMKGRSQEAENIVDRAFSEFQNFKIVKPGEELDQADVWLGEKTKVPLVTSDGLTVTMSRTARKEMKVSLSYDGPIKAPVQAGQQLGTLTVTAPDTPTQTIPVVAGDSVAKLGHMSRIGAALSYMIWGTTH
jgi:serine-type D-Ala-D-Ala carboxypeptidase (penicillin-binding protein 5/6)